MKQKLLTLFTLLLTVCSGAWADNEVKISPCESSQKDTYASSYWFVPDGTAITAIAGDGAKSGSGYNSGKPKIQLDGKNNPDATITFTIAEGVTVTSFKVNKGGDLPDNVTYALDGTAVTIGTALTGLSKTGSMTFALHCTDASSSSTARNTTIKSFDITYTTSGLNPAGLSYETTSITKEVGDDKFINTLSNPNSLTVTYSITTNGTGSSIDSETGEVTVGTSGGTETITASTEGDATHNAGTATYTLRINYLQSNVSSSKIWDIRSDISSSTDKHTDGQWKLYANIEGLTLANTFDGTSLLVNAIDGKYAYRNKYPSAQGASLKFHTTVAGKVRVTFKNPNNSSTRYLQINGVDYESSDGSEDVVSEYHAVSAGDVVITGSADLRFFKVEFVPTEVSVTISSAKYATFSSTQKLNFTGVEGLTAYKATTTDGSSVTLEDVTGIVPAGTGLLLKGNEATYYIPVSTAAATADVTGNKLQSTATTAHNIEDGEVGRAFVFGSLNKVVGFYKAAEGKTIGEGKSYLLLDTPLAKDVEFLSFVFGDEEQGETDGIKAVSTKVENGVRYNLAGQKVGADYKGIVIVNGKKYLRK